MPPVVPLVPLSSLSVTAACLLWQAGMRLAGVKMMRACLAKIGQRGHAVLTRVDQIAYLVYLCVIRSCMFWLCRRPWIAILPF